MNTSASHSVEDVVDAWRAAGMAGPQFGVMLPGVDYPVRAGAHGILRNESGLVAVVCIGRAKGAPQYDLPGGGVDPEESEEGALVREFAEETGLHVAPVRLVCRVGQYWRKDNITPRNSQFAIFEAQIVGAGGQPTEPHHVLEWTAPEDAIAKVRHEAHAWALRMYLQSR